MKNEARIGRFTVAGQPGDDELAGLKAAGYGLVVNVREPSEQDEPEAPKAAAAGLSYDAVPFTAATLAAEHVDALRAAIAAAPAGDILIH